MISALINILHKGVLEEDKPLGPNGLARRLLQFLLNNREAPDFLRILAQFIKSNSPVTFERWDLNKPYVDLRIKRMLLKDVRQYSLYSDIAEGYCLDFSESGYPLSSVFLGANGSGKSTLFASLEYIYLGYSDIAKAHNHNDDIEEFFRSINKKVMDIKMDCELQGNLSCEKNTIGDYGIPAAFCSECDYFQISRAWPIETTYIAKQIGFGEVWRFLEDLKELSGYLNLAGEYKKRQLQIKDAEKRRKGHEKDSKEYKAITAEISKIKKEQSSINFRFLANGGRKYYEYISKFIKEVNKCKTLDRNTKELTSLLKYVTSEWEATIGRLVEVIKSVVPAVMATSLIGGKESVTIACEKDKVMIDLDVMPRIFDDIKEHEDRNPIEYLNTFRLKLFCLALKLSFLISAKIFHRTVVPFFVDDIFDSSDFNHRAAIGKFIMKLLETHDKVISEYPGVANEELPLQLIFFTQDNIIAENVYNGLLHWSDENEITNEYGVKFRRLYTPAEVIIKDNKEAGVTSDIRMFSFHSVEKKLIEISDAI